MMDSNLHHAALTISQELEKLKEKNDLTATTVAPIFAKLCHLYAPKDQLQAIQYFGQSVQFVKEFCPKLSWMDIIKELDIKEVLLEDKRKKLTMLMSVFHCEKCPVEALFKPWKNLKSQFDLIEQILNHPDVFHFPDHKFQLVITNILKVEKLPKTEDIALWIYLGLFDLLMHFADHGLKDEVENLIKVPIEKCPEILILALVQSRNPVSCSHFRKELLSKLIRLFLDKRKNSKKILSLMLNQKDEAIEAIFVASIAKWSMEGEDLRSRLSRILDLSSDINSRYSAHLSGDDLIGFSIDVAFVASRRDYFKFEDWLSCEIEEKKEKLVSALLRFLQRHLTCRPVYGATVMKLPDDTILPMLMFLNSQVEKVDKCTKTEMEECILLLKKSILQLPVPMRLDSPRPKKSRPNHEVRKNV